MRENPPVLFLIMIIDPPPIPMLWGLTKDVHRRAAMAPSAAEPPCWSMLLEKKTSIYLDFFWEILREKLSDCSSHTCPTAHTCVLTFTQDLRAQWFIVSKMLECCLEASLNHVLILEQHTKSLATGELLLFDVSLAVNCPPLGNATDLTKPDLSNLIMLHNRACRLFLRALNESFHWEFRFYWATTEGNVGMFWLSLSQADSPFEVWRGERSLRRMIGRIKVNQ